MQDWSNHTSHQLHPVVLKEPVSTKPTRSQRQMFKREWLYNRPSARRDPTHNARFHAYVRYRMYEIGHPKAVDSPVQYVRRFYSAMVASNGWAYHNASNANCGDCGKETE